MKNGLGDRQRGDGIDCQNVREPCKMHIQRRLAVARDGTRIVDQDVQWTDICQLICNCLWINELQCDPAVPTVSRRTNRIVTCGLGGV